MKDSSEWVRQPQVDKAADEIVAERGCHPSEVKPNWVAKKLGVELNGALSEKVFDWRRRRLADNATRTTAVPPQAEAAFREHIEQFSRDALTAFRRTVGAVGGDIDHAAALRINDAERRRDQAEAERDELAVLCRKAEIECVRLQSMLTESQQQLDEVKRANERLLGRLEQREHDALRQGEAAAEMPAEVARPDVVADAGGTPDGAGVVDIDAPKASVAVSTRSDEPTAVANTANDQPSVAETPTASGGQIAMPIVSSADAEAVDGAGDDRG